ncbi:MAG: sirohydrochlorin cobaltochelatase [Desulfovibrionales bacterium]|jgi:sirohydrochlorin cobaltochelatase|nr:sirohydrochlorin cobaltochelatase [Desulfovibrionales bacterium]
MYALRKIFFPLFLICCLLTVSVQAQAGHGDQRPAKTGILLVAFGTSVPEAQAALANMETRVKAAFPGVPVRWAWTSSIIRHIMDKRGQHVDSPAEALARMMADGFTNVAIQSLHTIPGEEYHGLVQTAHLFQGMPKGLQRVLVGYPLLATPDDYAAAVNAMLKAAPAERKTGEALVLMGHGTPFPANACYPAFQYYLWKKDKNALVGTVEGSPTLDDVIFELKALKAKKVYLMPFMAVAGDHAHNDMAGPEPDSWKSRLEKEGFDVTCVLQGTADNPDIAAIWISHLAAALAHFK